MSLSQAPREAVSLFVSGSESKPDNQILLSKTVLSATPLDEAVRIAAKLRSSVEDVIGACVLVQQAHAKFSSNNSTYDEFINALVVEGVLAPREARLGAAQGTKLSMLKSIGEHAELLLRPEILRRLQPGYTILYQVGVLHKTLPGDENERFTQLVRILNECKGELNRKELLVQTRQIKKRARNGSSSVAQGAEAGVANVSGLYDHLLFTPSRDDIRALGADYASSTDLTRCLRAAGLADERAVAVVIATVRDIQIILDKLLPSCGFGRPSHILLAQEPASPDITYDSVIVIATRGEGAAVSMPSDFWESTSKNFDPVAIANELMPNGLRKLHIFAEYQAAPESAWTSLIGEQNWVERPSIQ